MGKKTFSKEFKLQILQELEAGKSTTELSREYELKPALIRGWKLQYRKNPEHAFSGKGIPSTTDTKIAQLERKIGQQAMEIDFVKKVNANLQAVLAELKKNQR